MNRHTTSRWVWGWVALAVGLVLAGESVAERGTPAPKNVIVLVPDGVGSAGTTMLRWYKGAKSGRGALETLNLDRMAIHGVRTFGANSLVTDSAPAATAFGCGYKSADKFVGVLPGGPSAPAGERVTIPGLDPVSEDMAYRPIASVLEAARVKGKKVGLVATSNIQHATPAGYSAHTHNRGQYERIGEQQVYGMLDVVLGGGSKYLGAGRADGEDLIAALQAMGYQYVDTGAELAAATGPKVWGLFAEEAMAYEFDRPVLRPDEPSLAEMTAKAIEILSQGRHGFLLMVEGSKVDWADHANDPIGVLSDLSAFDAAVGVALDYAQQHPGTLVLAFSDHNCGGMSIGNAGTSQTYSKMSFEQLVSPLLPAILTGEGVEQMIGADRSEANIRAMVSDYYGVNDLTAAEVANIQAAAPGSMNYVLGPILNSRSVLGWTSTGHVGDDLFLYSYGLEGNLGMLDNTDIAFLCADHLGVNLDMTTARLFAEAVPAFAAMGATTSLDATDPNNKVLVATKGSSSMRFPLDKNHVVIASRWVNGTFPMEGIAVLAEKTGKVYLPIQAIVTAWKLLR